MKIHIPTEQYGFIEVDVTGVAEAKLVSDEVAQAFGKYDFNYGGLNKLDFAKLRNSYMATGILNPDAQELLQKCNRDQRNVMNHIKLGMKQDELKNNE